MKRITLALSLMALASTTFAQEAQRVPEECEAMVYHKVNGKLPKKPFQQFIMSMYKNAEDKNKIDMTVGYDMGDENYCITSGTVDVIYNLDECSVKSFEVDARNFDCG